MIIPIHSEVDYDTWIETQELESGQTLNFFHCEVFYWRPSTLKRMITQWRIFRTHVPQALFCQGEVDDEKWAKFIHHFGFKYLTTVPCTDGKERRIFISGG